MGSKCLVTWTHSVSNISVVILVVLKLHLQKFFFFKNRWKECVAREEVCECVEGDEVSVGRVAGLETTVLNKSKL